MDTLPATTDRILENLKKYSDYLPLKDTKYAILTNLASIFLHNGQMPYCQELTEMTLETAKDSKRYDRLGFCQVRLGICKKDKELIDKGLTLLELTEEYQSLNNLKEEVRVYYAP